MVVNHIWQMSEDNQQLGWYKDKFVKEKRHSQAVEESLEKVSQRLHQTIEENRIVRLRTKMQHEENREEVIYQLPLNFMPQLSYADIVCCCRDEDNFFIFFLGSLFIIF